jgi:hypothetical protein
MLFMWRCSPEILETKMIDMDRLADGGQPGRARLEQKMQEPGAAEGFELVHEFAGLKKAARRSLQSEDTMAVHGLLEEAFNLVSKWDAEARLEEALYALLDSLDAPVSLKKGGGVCRCHLLCRAERGRQTSEQMGSSIAVCCVDQAVR